MQALAVNELQSRFECVAQQTARYEDGSVSVSVKRALDVLGQTGVAQAIRFAETDDVFLVGELVGSELDGRKNPMGRNIKDPGHDYRVMIPPAAFDHLEIDKEQVQAGEADLDVWVCTDPEIDESVIAISPHIRQTFMVDLEPLLGEDE
ncbi:hypothetical protein [Natrinema ejinorense]|uniref:hypothetical protein n=1 Tax=Natrinema ejinorense TaxID=373386 RepID=UPI0014726C7D|nr:hypothetical protein [Natrinema ejinorense]